MSLTPLDRDLPVPAAGWRTDRYGLTLLVVTLVRPYTGAPTGALVST
jgi:hypothetical protein